MRIVVAGGTGFIGKALCSRLLEAGHHLRVLSRISLKAQIDQNASMEIVGWDVRSLGSWSRSVDGVDAVINLAGASIGGKRWTEMQKKKILDSRTNATKAIVNAIAQAKTRPSVLMNMSAVGYYGDVPSGDVTETSAKGAGFLAEVCERWEAEARGAEGLGVRVVIPRLGVVLASDGGALVRMLLPFKLFVGGPLGSGGQWFPWIHRDDVLNALLFTITNSRISGPVNLAAPEAVTMREFSRTLGKVMHRPSWARMPAFILKAILGEMSSMVLTGQRIVPKKLQGGGFQFLYPKLDDALRAIMKK